MHQSAPSTLTHCCFISFQQLPKDLAVFWSHGISVWRRSRTGLNPHIQQVAHPPLSEPSACCYMTSHWFSRSVVSNSLQAHEPQHARSPCPLPMPRVYPNSCPLSRWCHPTISFSVVSFSPALNLSQHQGLFNWVSSSHPVAKVLDFELQHQSFQWTPRTDLL